MGVRLEKAGPGHEVHDLISEVMNEYHGTIFPLEVRFGVAFAFSDSDKEEPEPPVKWNKFPVTAKVEATKYAKRFWGHPDVVMTIDGAAWEQMPQDRREALVDELLAYLEPATDRDGNVKADDLGRPVLNVGLPDFCLMGHARVLERRGSAALSAQAFTRVLHELPAMRQLLISFVDDAAEPAGRYAPFGNN